MHCPNCGKKTSADLRFCRECGMKLDSVARAVSEHLGDEQHLQPAEKGSDGKVLRNFARLLFAGIMVVLIGAAMTVLGKEVQLLKTLGAMIAILGMMLAVCAVIYPMMRGGERALRPASPKKPKTKLDQPEQTEAALPAGDDFAAVPSVTEVTTRDLDGNKTKVMR